MNTFCALVICLVAILPAGGRPIKSTTTRPELRPHHLTISGVSFDLDSDDDNSDDDEVDLEQVLPPHQQLEEEGTVGVDMFKAHVSNHARRIGRRVEDSKVGIASALAVAQEAVESLKARVEALRADCNQINKLADYFHSKIDEGIANALEKSQATAGEVPDYKSLHPLPADVTKFRLMCEAELAHSDEPRHSLLVALDSKDHLDSTNTEHKDNSTDADTREDRRGDDDNVNKDSANDDKIDEDSNDGDNVNKDSADDDVNKDSADDDVNKDSADDDNINKDSDDDDVDKDSDDDDVDKDSDDDDKIEEDNNDDDNVKKDSDDDENVDKDSDDDDDVNKESADDDDVNKESEEHDANKETNTTPVDKESDEPITDNNQDDTTRDKENDKDVDNTNAVDKVDDDKVEGDKKGDKRDDNDDDDDNDNDDTDSSSK